MGDTIPPASKSQPAPKRDEDPHESVTIAPPAPNFDDMLREVVPLSGGSDSDQRFRAALDAGSRTGTSLSELSRIVADLSGGLSGAKLANEQLVHELSTLRAMLGSAGEQRLGLEQRLAELTQELVSVKQDAERERRFLTEQHDDFLAALLEEHEEALRARGDDERARRLSEELSELQQKLAQTEAARQQAESEVQRARDALAKAQAQRDEAQARAEKRERERDELRAEASQLRAHLGAHRQLSTAPPPAAPRPPSYRPPPALALDAAELDSTLRSRPAPRAPHSVPRFSPPPPELAGAVYTPRPASVTPSPATSGGRVSLRATEPLPRGSNPPGVGGPKPTEPPPAPNFGPSPSSGWTPLPPAPAAEATPLPRPPVISAASLPPGLPSLPALRQKPDPTTRPLIDYSLGGDGVQPETLEGARLSSKPPRK